VSAEAAAEERPAEPLAEAVLAVPGDPDTPTGGYAYARRLMAAAGSGGLGLRLWPLPGGFPDAPPDALAETARRLAALPAGWPVIVDGLALGVLDPAMLRGLDAPVIALCHHPLGLETGVAPDRAAALIASETAALAACAHVLTTSRTTADTLTARLGVPADRITVARPGTDPAPAAVGSGGPTVRLLSVGSLTPRKGHDQLIAALATMPDLDWSLTIVGPDDRDPAHAQALRAQVAQAGLSTRITLAGAAEPAALSRDYAQADLFALASRFEGYGMAYTEAMAHGLPTLGCDTGAVAEATRGAALLVAPDDMAGLADALRRLIADAPARDALARACRSAAADLPRWTDTAGAVAAAVTRVTQEATR
jgi:glycosyltransferase involved in cell wall biosynthesis